jgi:hypothetical protein
LFKAPEYDTQTKENPSEAIVAPEVLIFAVSILKIFVKAYRISNILEKRSHHRYNGTNC